MEGNHMNTFGRNNVSSMSGGEEPGGNQVTENDSCIGNHGFPRKPAQNEKMDYDYSEDFTPHIITRMPDLTGYGHETAPQGISLYRPKYDRTQVHLEILKKLRKMSLQKWCAILAIAIVAGLIGWGLFHGADSQKVAQKSISDSSEAEKKLSENATPIELRRSAPTQAAGDFRFDDLNNGASSERTTGDQVNYFSGVSTSPSSQNHFGPQSIVPVDSTASQISQYQPGVTNIAMATPDTSSREIPPWERQPNSPANVAPTNNNFASYANGAVASPQATQNNTYSQDAYPQNASSQNGQFPPVSQQQGFAGMANDYGYSQNASGVPTGMPNGPLQSNAGTYPNTGAVPYNAQPNQQYSASTSQQIAGGFGAMPQQVSYQQAPVSHETAIAANTNQMSTHLQGQGQWSGQGQPQNTTYMPPYAASQNPSNNYSYTQQNQQPSYSGNGTQYAPAQGIGASVPQLGMSNVPVMTSGQSYRDTAATGTNFSGTPNQYPGNQPQQPIPYNNNNTTAASYSQDLYR